MSRSEGAITHGLLELLSGFLSGDLVISLQDKPNGFRPTVTIPVGLALRKGKWVFFLASN
jgi:hypothetical protein